MVRLLGRDYIYTGKSKRVQGGPMWELISADEPTKIRWTETAPVDGVDINTTKGKEDADITLAREFLSRINGRVKR